jgi:hypothetical protein
VFLKQGSYQGLVFINNQKRLTRVAGRHERRKIAGKTEKDK